MTNSNSQKIEGNNNQMALGDINNNVFPTSQLSLQAAINKIVKETEDDPEFQGFIEELSLFTSSRSTRKVIGLEAKLKKANREDLIDEATFLKEKFAKKLSKNQLSMSIQKIYVQILAYICTLFRRKIKPLIKAGEEITKIEEKIFSEIIDNIYNQISGSTVSAFSLNTEEIDGMIYYLTGKCHIDWV